MEESSRVEQPQPCCCELEREWQAVQPPADLLHLRRRLRAPAHRCARGRGRARPLRAAAAGSSGYSTSIETCNGIRLVTSRVGPGELARKLAIAGAASTEVLEVVEDEQRAPVGIVGLREAERLQGDRQHEVRIGQCCERDEMHPVGELVQELGGDLERETRLARAAGAGDGHEPDAPEQILDLELLDHASDERMRRLRQVRSVEAPERRKRAEPQLVDALRAGQVLQAVLAEIDDLVLVDEQVARRVREENLPAVPGGRDPGGAVHVHAHIAVLRQQRLARMDAHPHADAVLLQESLRRAGRARRIARPAEGDEEGVALGVDLDARRATPRPGARLRGGAPARWRRPPARARRAATSSLRHR